MIMHANNLFGTSLELMMTFSITSQQQLNEIKSRLFEVTYSYSSDWLHALPIGSCDLRLENEDIRVAVGLRLGAALCQAHQCP